MVGYLVITMTNTRRTIALVLMLLPVACPCWALSLDAPQAPRLWWVYLPMVATPSLSAPLKGACLFSRDCETVRLLDLDWYYLGPRQCDGAEFVYYWQEPDWKVQPATRYTMFFNEPELAGWSVAQMVTAFIPYAAQNPDTIWVGPCVAWDLDLVPQFWAEYKRLTGRAMSPHQIRLCYHCYYDTDACLRQVPDVARLARQMGLPERSLWLTEFGQPLGLDRTMRAHVAEVKRLVDGLQASPYVERFAYWPGLYWPLPNAPEPVVSYVPLLYTTYSPGGSGDFPAGFRLTEMGWMYRGE